MPEARHAVIYASMRPLSFFAFVGLFTAGLAPASEKPPAVSIAALVDQTLAENPEVRFYESEIQAAKAGKQQARKWANPELSLDAARKSVRSSDSSSSGLAWSVALAQPIEWPGRIALRKAIANSDLTLAELGLSRFKQAVSSKVRVLAYELALQQEKAAASAEVQDRLTSLREVIVQRDPAGVTPLLEAKIIEATTIVTEKESADAAIELQRALLELNQLRGRRADSPLVVERSEFSFSEYPGIPQLLSNAAVNNYEMKVRIAEIEAQGLKVALAKNERYPSFTVGPVFSQEKAGEKERTAGIAFSIPLPLWDNGKAAITTAEVRQIQAQASLLTTQREIERQVTEAALVYETQRQRLLRWKPETLDSFRDAAILADRHYRLGAVEITTYIELQEKYLEAVEAISATKAEALKAALLIDELSGSNASGVTLKSQKQTTPQ